MKTWVKLTAGVMLIFFLSMVALVIAQRIKRPKSLEWSEAQIGQMVSEGMTRNEVLTVAGEPNNTSSTASTETWHYWNPSLSKQERTSRRIPGSFSVTFENDKVSLCLMAHY